MISKLNLSFVVFSLFASAATQSQITDAPKDATAMSLVQSCLSSMTPGSSATDQSVVVVATLRLYGDQNIDFPVVIKSRGSNLVRTEITTKQGMRIFILNNGHGLIRYPDGGLRYLSEENTALQRANHIPFFSLLSEFSSKEVALEYVGESTKDGAAVNVVALSAFRGATVEEQKNWMNRTRAYFYLDKQTGYLNSISYPNYAENDLNVVENFEVKYSQYKQLNGFLIPTQQDTYSDGHLFSTLLVESIGPVAPLQDSNFKFSE